MPHRWYIPVKVRKSKQSYVYPRVTIPVEALRKAGVKPNDILVLLEAGGVLVLAKEGAEGDPEALLAGVLEALGYEVSRGEGGIAACRDGECLIVARVRLPRGASGGSGGSGTRATS